MLFDSLHGPTPGLVRSTLLVYVMRAWINLFANMRPPQDGNGRVGRLLSSIPLLRCGLPPINIMGSAALDAVKQEYVDALVKVSQVLLYLPRGCLIVRAT